MGHENTCQARDILDRVGDKWSMYVIAVLSRDTKRFNELRREIDGISQRVLTVTLRGLERDGMITRTMYPVIPPRVEYTLTPVGRTLIELTGPLVTWAHAHVGQVEAARAAYDARAEEVTEAFG